MPGIGPDGNIFDVHIFKEALYYSSKFLSFDEKQFLKFYGFILMKFKG